MASLDIFINPRGSAIAFGLAVHPQQTPPLLPGCHTELRVSRLGSGDSLKQQKGAIGFRLSQQF